MTGRAFLILLAFIGVTLGVNAQGYYCDRQGATLNYVRKKAKTGETEWRHIMNIKDVSKVADGTQITSVSTFLKANGKPLYKQDVIEQAILDEKDNVQADMGLTVASYIKARTGISASATGTLTMIPADMQPGDTLPPVVVNAKVGPLNYSVRIYDRKVVRKETISVPAGKFDCMVLEEKKIENGPGHNRQVLNVSWYCKGTGYVRHDTYIKGVLDTSEILFALN